MHSRIIGLEANSKLASISDEFSQDLSKPKKERRLKQTDLVKDSRRNIQFGSKRPGGIPYYEVGIATANIKFENSWMEFFESDWETQLDFLKVVTMDFGHLKPYGSDAMNNYGNNTNKEKGGKPFPEMITYWNFYHTD